MKSWNFSKFFVVGIQFGFVFERAVLFCSFFVTIEMNDELISATSV